MGFLKKKKQQDRNGFHLIDFFVRHPTAGNLLMVVMLIFGAFAIKKLNTQFFPTIEVPAISVSVSWPGASPEDVEKNILEAIEPELRFLEDVEEVISYAREGVGFISMEFFADADMQKAQSSVEQAISTITTLPEDSEEPVITRASFFDRVGNISISADVPEQVLKSYAKLVRNELLRAGIDQVSFSGLRKEEVWVELREADLQRLNLTLDQISKRIRSETKDTPSGTIKGSVELQLRALADRKTPEEIGQIEIVSSANGDRILLRDIADIKTKFDEDAVVALSEGKPAIRLTVSRALSADTLKTMELMETTIARLQKTLPPSVRLKVYDVRGKLVKGRLGILIKNGIQGLVLVLITLFIFLNWRVAFWCAAGIPVAFMATLFVMWFMGQTINMISMFGLIMMLGIVVDDAIVVGEDTATRYAKGYGPKDAATGGAQRMLAPVLAATLTTQAAFLPILLIGDRIGDIMSAIPLVVMAVLIASLLECFLILPAHLSHAGKIDAKPGGFRHWFDGGLERFRSGPYQRFVRWTYDWRYATVASSLAIFIIGIGLLAGGRVGFQFFPSPESEKVKASVVFGAGTPLTQQKQIMSRIGKSLDGVIEQLANGRKLVENRHLTLGQSGRNQGENLAELTVQLLPSEDRDVRTKAFIKAWRDALPDVPGLERIAISGSRIGPPGRDLDVKIRNAPIEKLKAAALELQDYLSGVPGVTGVSDDLPFGKPELIMELTARGSALGFTTQDIGTQIRNVFQGAIAVRFARDEEEVTVRVKRSQSAKGLGALDHLYVSSPSGERVPLRELVTLKEKRGFSIIQRRDGVRTVSVGGDIDFKKNTVEAVAAQLRAEKMPEISEKFGVDYEFGGRDEERAKSFADLKVGALIALAMIYIILAWVFASYAQPLAVIAIIPFGLIGSIFGHLIMGQNMTIISVIGLLGLSGILVNDSIVLMSQLKTRMEEGNDLREAAIGASQDRLRAVLLTSLTTIGGLLPLMFETSRQAQFLIPMAITMVFGLAAATLLVLVLVPAVAGIGGDLGRLWRAYLGLGKVVPLTANKS